MSEKNSVKPLAKLRDWVSAHPIITGVVIGSSVMIACDVIARWYEDRAEVECAEPLAELAEGSDE